MERLTDLDQAAAVVTELLAERSDLEAGPITWKGFESRFGEPLKADRHDVVDPYSFGVAVRRGEAEGRLVLYVGGWADVEYWSGDVSDDLIDRVHGWEDWLSVPRFEGVVAEFLALFDPTS